MKMNLVKLSILLIVSQLAYSSPLPNEESEGQSVISQGLLDGFLTESTADIIVKFSGNAEALEEVKNKKYANRGERLNTISTTLQAHAQKSQENVARFLNGKDPQVPFTSYWSTNTIFIRNASPDLINELAGFPEVTEIRENSIVATIIQK